MSGEVGNEIDKLIRQEPERYSIIESSEELQEGEIFEGENGGKARVVARNYPRQGFYVIDITPIADEPPVEPVEHDAKMEKPGKGNFDEPLSILEEGRDIPRNKDNNRRTISSTGYIDILSKSFGQMTSKRLVSKIKGNIIYTTVIEFSELPVVFIGINLEDCIQKVVKFMMMDIFDLVKIFERKEIRSDIRNTLGELVRDQKG